MSRSSSDIKAIGIIAGGGTLPAALMDSCDAQGISYFLAAFEGQSDPAIVDGRPHIVAKLGQPGKIIKAFRAEGIDDVVMIGSIRRPSFSELIPDLKAAKFFAKNARKAMGDSDLLSALREFLEDEGFALHGIQDFAPDLLAPNALLTRAQPSKDDWIDIRRGVDLLQHMGALDVGQAVIVQDGLVLGVEAIEGTDRLIERCGGLRRKGRKGCLVKLCKPQQDMALDLPTIGMRTLENIKDAGLGGVVVHAGKSLISDQESLVSFADTHKLYVVGIDPEDI